MPKKVCDWYNCWMWTRWSETEYHTIEQQYKLAEECGDFFGNLRRYRRLVGRLLYLTITRANITYAVHILSQFMQQSQDKHQDATLWVVWYIKGNLSWGILLPKTNQDLNLIAYCDSDWAVCPKTHKSVMGYFLWS